MIIKIHGVKGGSGKTTISKYLFYYFRKKERKRVSLHSVEEIVKCDNPEIIILDNVSLSIKNGNIEWKLFVTDPQSLELSLNYVKKDDDFIIVNKVSPFPCEQNEIIKKVYKFRSVLVPFNGKLFYEEYDELAEPTLNRLAENLLGLRKDRLIVPFQQ
ncbi:hypothetical protein [Acidianus ambivalens]|uniref:CobQ/CobB/MinD/ParA nucleotide binding domain-containing protein n=1 Tax=Acidianus ambivalens TaxID=2283 RepID=A0A650CSZ5_ACIAM|nr:hypothetical protein [Acidianus ambivalens]MQL55439.1 hypothetical protein [Acidianus ambivalens]QGR20974.1 hypothetical protein D1866_02235 [Acidianus ambivalens]